MAGQSWAEGRETTWEAVAMTQQRGDNSGRADPVHRDVICDQSVTTSQSPSSMLPQGGQKYKVYAARKCTVSPQPGN